MAPAMSRRILSFSHRRRRSRPTFEMACKTTQTGCLCMSMHLAHVRSTPLPLKVTKTNFMKLAVWVWIPYCLIERHLELHLVRLARGRPRRVGGRRAEAALPLLLLAAVLPASGAATAAAGVRARPLAVPVDECAQWPAVRHDEGLPSAGSHVDNFAGQQQTMLLHLNSFSP